MSTAAAPCLPRFAGANVAKTAPEVAAAPAVCPTVYIETYGCQMNVLDSELVAGQLQTLGYRLVATPQDASMVLLNTCSVRQLSEEKVWSYLGRLALAKKAHKNLIVGVLGCMAEREGAAIFARAPHVDVVCGPANLDQLPLLLENARQQQGMQLSLAGHTARRSATLQSAQDGLETLDLARANSPVASHFQTYVRITRGCNKFCTFCVVPYTRGPEVHRAPAAIVREIQNLVARGSLEITLLGQTINHYSYHDGGKTTSFADLLYRIHEAVPDLPRLRFLTSYPRDFGDDALDVMAACRRLCRYLHIPAQSGSNTLLKRMNRGYSVEAYLDLLARARRRMPDIAIAGDMIAGFSGETEACHAASLTLLRQAQLKSCFIFKYSPRPHTVAMRRLPDDVPEAVKKTRHLELLQLQASISLQQQQRHLGQVLDVLVESHNPLQPLPTASPSHVHLGWRPSKNQHNAAHVRLIGRTPGDVMVAFEGPTTLVGQLVQVHCDSAQSLTLHGRWRA